jgi:acyl carrier protein
MENVKTVIDSAILNIQEMRAHRKINLDDDLRLTYDLGFSSLDIAQLVAQLELELGVDPFSQGVSIAEITTIGSLYRVYQTCINSNRG